MIAVPFGLIDQRGKNLEEVLINCFVFIFKNKCEQKVTENSGNILQQSPSKA